MPTTNPVPSHDPSDLLFNAGKLDEVVSGASTYYTDRLGANRRTIEGINASADVVLAGLGYAPPVIYAAGISLTLATQTVEYSGEVYAPKVADLPFTTSGTFETAKFRLIQGVAYADLPTLVGQDLQDYAALRSYTGSATRIYITGQLVTAKPAGIAGVFQYDQTDTVSVDNGGTIIVGADGRRWKRDHAEQLATVESFGAVGDGTTNDYDPIQRCVNWAISWNGVVRFLGKNYILGTGLSVESPTFRTIRFQGVGTGNAQTASSGGTCLVVSGIGIVPITATFNAFANENIIVDGINFYNTTLNQLNNLAAIKIVRGASNGRYISGFKFHDVGIIGFGAAFEFQGMNIVNADNNHIGSVLFDSVSVQQCGVGISLKNCVLNLATLRNTVFLDCMYGGIRCERDGDVAPGTGKGSAFIGTLTDKTHFEGVGGMFRTDPTTVINSLGDVIRSSITLIDFTHESCGGTVAPVAGEPFQLGANTDIHVLGHVVDGISYGEVLLPYLNSTARIWCDSRMRVVCNGGRIMTPKGVNAPTIYRTLANESSTTISIPLVESTGFAIKSNLILGGGQAGYIESQHFGYFGTIKNTVSSGSPSAGITLTWSTAADANAISVQIYNASGFSIPIELQVENLSSASITLASDV